MHRSMDSQDTEQVLRESVRKAKEKLVQAQTRPNSSLTDLKRFDTFNENAHASLLYSDRVQRKVSLKDRSQYSNMSPLPGLT